MIISLFELGVWASWAMGKQVAGGAWGVVSYAIWGRVPTHGEVLMKRLELLEDSNRELTAAVLACGTKSDKNVSENESVIVPKPVQTIKYILPVDNSPKNPPPAAGAIALPIPPTYQLRIHEHVKHRVATTL